jgi:hypothetical protein
MRTKQIIISCFCTILVFFWVGCTKQTSIPQMSNIDIPEGEINKHIVLEAPEGWNTFQIGDVIRLTVSVILDDQIAYNDNDVIILFLEDERWVEIPNFITNSPGYTLLTASDSPFDKGAIAVYPVLENIDEDMITLRIILFGYVYRDGEVTTEKTAAYIDVNLSQ